MDATEIITLVCLILVTGGVTTFVFEVIKKWLPANDGLRSLAAWAVSVVLALAGTWLAGDVLGILGKWRDGSLTAQDLFLYGNGVAVAANILFQTYYKGLKPTIEAGKSAVATLVMRISGPNTQRLASALTSATKVLKEESEVRKE
ncbi:MAG: hypothetical protein JXA57_11085 [Armatimonadetes bacterium]|nr:hypothetical protein [Armatimonadota bacterium]